MNKAAVVVILLVAITVAGYSMLQTAGSRNALPSFVAAQQTEVACGACGYVWDTTEEEDGPEFNIEIIVTDKQGNRGMDLIVVLVDNTPPEITSLSPEKSPGSI